VSDADLFTVVSSLAWIFGLALGFAFGYFAGFSRGRGRRMAIRAERATRIARGSAPHPDAAHPDAAAPGGHVRQVPDPPLAPHPEPRMSAPTGPAHATPAHAGPAPAGPAQSRPAQSRPAQSRSASARTGSPRQQPAAPPASPPEWRGRLSVTGTQPTPESLSSRDTVPIPRFPA
jgi:hypothetical protein